MSVKIDAGCRVEGQGERVTVCLGGHTQRGYGLNGHCKEAESVVSLEREMSYDVDNVLVLFINIREVSCVRRLNSLESSLLGNEQRDQSKAKRCGDINTGGHKGDRGQHKGQRHRIQ